MRADRLLSLLMLLQTRGQMAAHELARELEVSVRTIYRDIEALSTAGVPVYAERGPGGGCSLIDGYRTSLTGLSADEVRALFMLSIPASLDELGTGRELKSALLKLAAALPAARRQDEEQVRQRIYLDWSAEGQVEEPVPHLQTMQQAMWEDRTLHLAYHMQIGPHALSFERRVDPYGLVARAGVWHLVCAGDGRMRVYRVSRVLDARLTSERFERPANFDLAAFWKAWCAGQAEDRAVYLVKARVAPQIFPFLPLYLGESIHEAIAQAGPPEADGWVTLTFAFDRLEQARERILGMGGAVQVLEPEALRESVVDFAAQITALYAEASDTHGTN